MPKRLECHSFFKHTELIDCCKIKNETVENGLQSSAYVRRLQREIEEIEARIAELTDEKLALKRQLVKAHWEENALRDVSRKNSGTRIMVEERILDALRHARGPLSNTALFETAKRANFELKPVTFRTYLKRLKEKGAIQSVGRGAWMLEAVRLCADRGEDDRPRKGKTDA